MSKVPPEVVAAINTLLAPYGETYTPGAAKTAESSGFVNWGGAVRHTGLSKSTLQRAIRDGRLKPPHKMSKSMNGTALFEISELDRFIRSH